MAQILKLGKARKARREAAEAARADENAVRHGRTREQRDREVAERARVDAQLDGALRIAEPVVAADPEAGD